jgi:RimJ/RimL family protein N-acetyltransferase
VGVRPAFRGRGLGADVVVALCEYGFAVRGLHRLQVDTLTRNTAMIRAAERAGFVHEGRLRRAAWVNGEFADVVILGLLAAEEGRRGEAGNWARARSQTGHADRPRPHGADTVRCQSE